MKICRVCNVNKKNEDFYRNKKSKDGLATRCKDCNKKYCKEWHSKNRTKSRAATAKYEKKNKELVKERRLLSRYGLDKETYNILVAKSELKCAICKQEKELHVDHDHDTLKVRGLLCMQCNTAIGLFKDNKEYLKNAIQYLDMPL